VTCLTVWWLTLLLKWKVVSSLTASHAASFSSSFTWSHNRNSIACVCHLVSKPGLCQLQQNQIIVENIRDCCLRQNITQSYICMLTSMGCAERPLSLSAQFQWCGDNRSFTYKCIFGFRLLTQLQWLSLWWILLVAFTKLLLHISNIIHLLILSDTDICGLYESEIWIRLATHQYMWPSL
jgi:hypothetical protein